MCVCMHIHPCTGSRRVPTLLTIWSHPGISCVFHYQEKLVPTLGRGVSLERTSPPPRPVHSGDREMGRDLLFHGKAVTYSSLCSTLHSPALPWAPLGGIGQVSYRDMGLWEVGPRVLQTTGRLGGIQVPWSYRQSLWELKCGDCSSGSIAKVSVVWAWMGPRETLWTAPCGAPDLSRGKACVLFFLFPSCSGEQVVTNIQCWGPPGQACDHTSRTIS